MVSTSLKPDTEIFAQGVHWIPRTPQWSNYPAALTAFPFARYLGNTLFIAITCSLGVVLSSSLVAYGFSRVRWPGRDALFLLMLSTIMLPEQVTLIPVFILFRKLGWTGTYLPLIVPSFFGAAISIFLLRQFFRTIPQELSDAAEIDGCSDWQIFTGIVLPLSRPALATIGLLVFINRWMDYMGPLVYLHRPEQYTLALGLYSFIGRHGAEWNLLMAAATVVTLPLVAVFFLAQKQFIEGITLTGMKG
ncbi:MAG: carbohydrate ABC transporter permease [Armatimonadetes bacterium]|nr:carbohydrate ABC transporter permease [Armatimonadota bacterium]